MKNMVSLKYGEPCEYWKVNIDDVLNGFRNIYFRHLLENAEKQLANANEGNANLEIKKIPEVIIWGCNDDSDHFNHYYSGFVLLDIKDLSDSNADNVILKIESIPSTYSWFYHPFKPNCILVLVLVDSSFEDYDEALKQVAEYYQDNTGHIIDHNPNEHPKSFYCTFQPDIYINPNCEQFNVIDYVEV